MTLPRTVSAALLALALASAGCKDILATGAFPTVLDKTVDAQARTRLAPAPYSEEILPPQAKHVVARSQGADVVFSFASSKLWSDGEPRYTIWIDSDSTHNAWGPWDWNVIGVGFYNPPPASSVWLERWPELDSHPVGARSTLGAITRVTVPRSELGGQPGRAWPYVLQMRGSRWTPYQTFLGVVDGGFADQVAGDDLRALLGPSEAYSKSRSR